MAAPIQAVSISTNFDNIRIFIPFCSNLHRQNTWFVKIMHVIYILCQFKYEIIPSLKSTVPKAPKQFSIPSTRARQASHMKCQALFSLKKKKKKKKIIKLKMSSATVVIRSLKVNPYYDLKHHEIIRRQNM